MMKRTHTCGELRSQNESQEVILNGWVASTRDHGGVIFIDLRDRYGITQIVFNPDRDKDLHDRAKLLRPEYVISVKGTVGLRPEGTINEKLPTGQVEVYVTELELLNKSKTPPFEISEAEDVSQEIRLKYRYIDLRSDKMRQTIIFRHRFTKFIRDYLDKRGFLEIETPFLTKSTPEGARDYLVPSRINPGTFYALPQSPQLFKQILMVSGFDKYFQIVRCFRDEDLRADRQPEFTQLDLEMSFVDENDVTGLIEDLVVKTFDELLDVTIPAPIPRLTYEEAMRDYGTDRPDIRFEMKLKDISDIAQRSEFKVFTGTVEKGGIIKGFNATGAADAYSRKDLDELTDFVKEFKAKGLAWFKVTGGKLASPIAKFFPDNVQKELMQRLSAEEGDLLLFVADKSSVVNQALSELRLRIARKLNIINPDDFKLCWVYDFPLFEYNEEEKRLDPLHHPFTSPSADDLKTLQSNPLSVKARAYDIVLNGTEIGGGSIRIHDEKTQEQVFSLLNISEEEARMKFGFLLDALKFGAPPHGGIALGLDRIVMLMRKLDTIRDTIAFPKTQKAVCLLTDAPSKVDSKQLKELGLL